MPKLISALPDLPENIDCEAFNAIPPKTYEFTEMIPQENRFLFGLIRHFKPKNILEIGISSGGSSGLILNAIKDMSETTLTSIDKAENAYRYPDKPVGFAALKENANNPQWTLIPGKDPSEVIERFGKKFDFAIIDTAHIHPIETLNFLSVLPFLEDGAVVVLHDLSLYIYREVTNFSKIPLATRYLFSSVVGEKIVLSTVELPNIGAFQITADTHKYIDGVFYSLAVPWGFIPEAHILDSIRSIIRKYYDENKLKLFDNAIKTNNYIEDKKLRYTTNLSNILRKYEGKYILFGARNAKNYINIIESIGFNLPLEIWDNKVQSGEIYGVPVLKPHDKLDDKTAIIFSVKTRFTYNLILEEFPNSLKSQTYFIQY